MDLGHPPSRTVTAGDAYFVIGAGVCIVTNPEVYEGTMKVADQTVELTGLKLHALEPGTPLTVGHAAWAKRAVRIRDPALIGVITDALTSTPSPVPGGPQWYQTKGRLERALRGTDALEDLTAAVRAIAGVIRDLHTRITCGDQVPGDHQRFYERACRRICCLVAVLRGVSPSAVTIKSDATNKPSLHIKK